MGYKSRKTESPKEDLEARDHLSDFPTSGLSDFSKTVNHQPHPPEEAYHYTHFRQEHPAVRV